MRGDGGFAEAFVTAFLAARRLRMDNERWQFQKKWYEKVMQSRFAASDAAAKGRATGYGNAAASEGSLATKGEGGGGASLSGDDRDLTIRTIYGEAGNQGEKGQAGVASVIRNRTMDSAFGGGKGNVRDVILEPKQFSLWNKGDPAGDMARKLDPNSDAYKKIGDIVDGVWSGKIADPTNGAVNYYNPSVASPAWGNKLAQTNDVRIGDHRFVGKGNFDLKPTALAGAPDPTKDVPAEDARLKKEAGAAGAGKNISEAEAVKIATGNGTPEVPGAKAIPATPAATPAAPKDPDAALKAPFESAFGHQFTPEEWAKSKPYLTDPSKIPSFITVGGAAQMQGFPVPKGADPNMSMQDYIKSLLPKGAGEKTSSLPIDRPDATDPSRSNLAAVTDTVDVNKQFAADVNPTSGSNSALPMDTASMYSPQGAGGFNAMDPYGGAYDNAYGGSGTDVASNDFGGDFGNDYIGGGGGDFGGGWDFSGDFIGGGGGFGMAAAKGGVVRRYEDGGEVDDLSTDASVDDASFSPDAGGDLIGGAAGGDYSGGALPVSPAAYGMPSMSRGMGAGMGAGAPRMAGPPANYPMGMRSGRENPFASTDMPQIVDGEGGLSEGATNAIQGGVRYLAQLLGGTGGIPNGPEAMSARDQFHGGHFAMTEAQASAVKKAVDPSGTLDDSMANIAGLEALHKFYLQQGDIHKADAAALSMLEYTKETAAKYAGEAYNKFHRGDRESGARLLERAYDEIPTGDTAHIKPLEDGSYLVTQKDAQGRVMRELQASPQQIFSAALGLKNGTLYWQALNERLQPKPKGAQFSDEDHKAFAEAEQMRGAGTPQTAAAPRTALPPPPAPAAGATPPAMTRASTGNSPPPVAPGDTLPAENSPVTGTDDLGEETPGVSENPVASTSAQDDTAQPAQGAQGTPLAVQVANGERNLTPPAQPTAIPVTPKGNMLPPQMQKRMAMTAQAYAAFGVERAPPAWLTQYPSNWDKMSPAGQQRFIAQRKVDYTEWRRTNDMRRLEADKAVAAQMGADTTDARQKFTVDQQERGANMRLKQTQIHDERMIKAREDAQNRGELFKQGLTDDLEASKEHLLYVRPPSVKDWHENNMDELDPNVYQRAFESTLGEQVKSTVDRQVADLAVQEIGRYNNMKPSQAMSVVAAMVTPVDPMENPNQITVKEFDHRTDVAVADVDGLDVRMPKALFVKLAAMRVARRNDAVKRTLDEGQKTYQGIVDDWNNSQDKRAQFEHYHGFAIPLPNQRGDNSAELAGARRQKIAQDREMLERNVQQRLNDPSKVTEGLRFGAETGLPTRWDGDRPQPKNQAIGGDPRSSAYDEWMARRASEAQAREQSRRDDTTSRALDTARQNEPEMRRASKRENKRRWPR